MKDLAEIVVYCEGYYDRSFWKGWLEHLGCVNLFQVKPFVFDPQGRPVKGGHYGFENRAGEFVRLVPCNGKHNILQEARSRLQQLDTEPTSHVVLNWDDDSFDQPEAVNEFWTPARRI